MWHRKMPVEGETPGAKASVAGFAAYQVIMKLAIETTGRPAGWTSGRKIESLVGR